MGQKVNPHGFRVGINKDWDSRWFPKKGEMAALIKEDAVVREFVKKKLYLAGVAKIEIERLNDKMNLFIWCAKPGMVIGKSGQGIEELTKDLQKIARGREIKINVQEVQRPERDAQLVAENIAAALERRIAFRRAMKQAMQRAMKAGATGIKVSTSGRVGGAEMARTEGYAEGNVPLHTLRADIQYGFAEADTTYGKLGVKVWISNGEILPGKKEAKRTFNQPIEQPKGSDRNKKRRFDDRDKKGSRGPRKPRTDNRAPREEK